MNKFKKYTADIDLILGYALVLMASSYLPVPDSLTAVMLYIKFFSNIVVIIIMVYLYVRMSKKANRMGVRIVFGLLFLNAFIISLLIEYRTFIKILNLR